MRIFGGLPKLAVLNNYFERGKEIILKAGDVGAFYYLPRLICFQNDKYKIIINGIGD
tara:strand:- start:585 stop:755 length:171 start_codon:yes stop_codon:yes gene_type:complete